MRTLLLNPPSYRGFDGGAGSRYQARREVRSFWYPTWLAQAAALVPDSRLIDAPADDLSLEDVVERVAEFDLVILHTSTPSLSQDAKTAAHLREAKPRLCIGLVGPHAMVLPEETLRTAPAADFAATGEFDYVVKEVAEGRPLAEVDGILWRGPDGSLRRNPDRPPIRDLDAIPFASDVYARDLTIENYFIGYLLHPYLSLYTGRGCRSRCTFCLWPQTIGGHAYRTRSVEHVLAEMAHAKQLFPQVKEFFFDDDTFTDDLPRAEKIARGLGKLGVTWSCNAKANVPYQTLRVMREGGLRLLLVGFESGNQQILNSIRKGLKIERVREFARDCHELGILMHGTFVLGLPGETRETIEQTLAFAKEIDPYSLQVSLAAPYPGTELYRQAVANGWLSASSGAGLVQGAGIQETALSYDELGAEEIHRALEHFYRSFYLRPRPILRMVRDMLRDRRLMQRRLREGFEFFSFLARRRHRRAAEAT